MIGGARLARGDEEQAERRIERRRHEVGAAPLIGQASLAAVVEDDRPAVGADLARPGRVGERLAEEQLPGHAVEHVEEAVAIGDHDDLPPLSADRQVGEHRHVIRIPVVRVVRRELVVPLAACRWRRRAPPASWCRGCRPADPRRSSRDWDCRCPSTAGSAPGRSCRSPRWRHRRAPSPRPTPATSRCPARPARARCRSARRARRCADRRRRGIRGSDTRRPRCRRSPCRRRPAAPASPRSPPCSRPARRPTAPCRSPIERQQMRVERHHEQPIAQHAEAAVHRRRGAVGEIGGQLAPVLPERPPGARVERPGEVVRSGHVEHAVPRPAAWPRTRGRASSCRSGRSTARPAGARSPA